MVSKHKQAACKVTGRFFVNYATKRHSNTDYLYSMAFE